MGKYTLKRRICEGLLLFVCLCIILCGIHKFLLDREDWLSYSIMWSISWSFGVFLGRLFQKKYGIGYLIIINILIIFIAFIVEAFVFRIILDMSTWKEIIYDTLFPFGLSLILFTNILK